MRVICLWTILAAMMFQGCATMKKEECLTADWHQIGYEDGIKGYAPDRVGRHRKACAEYGVSPDLTAYNQGRIEGLALYCTPAEGFSLGRRGKEFNDTCTPLPDLEKAFHQGYLAGREIFLTQEEVARRDKELSRLKEELAALETRIKEKEALLSRNCGDQASCRRALDVIRDLDREARRKKQRIAEERKAIAALSRTLKDQRAASPY